MQSALIGAVSIKIVKNISDARGNVAVGHAVGTNVRFIQTTTENPLIRVQLRARLYGNDKYSKKMILDTNWNLHIPVPFISKLVSLPLCLIDNIVYTQIPDLRDTLNDPVIEFSITLVEYRVNAFIKISTQAAWLIWTNNTYPDPASKLKLYPTPPTGIQESAAITTEYISSNAVSLITVDDLPFETRWSVSELAAVNIINKRFSKLPFNQSGAFPQSIKLQYPPSTSYYNEFNTTSGLPTDFIDKAYQYKNLVPYAFPVYNQFQNKSIVLTIAPKMVDNIVYATLIVIIDGETSFNLKVVPNKIYTIYGYQITFNIINIESTSVQPKNGVTTSTGTIIEGGIRII
jgi:hypothetical protein